MKNGTDDGRKKYVDHLGIIEIRATSDDPEYYEDPIDMFNWQQTARQPDLGFHEKFCQKNKSTTIHCNSSSLADLDLFYLLFHVVNVMMRKSSK